MRSAVIIGAAAALLATPALGGRKDPPKPSDPPASASSSGSSNSAKKGRSSKHVKTARVVSVLGALSASPGPRFSLRVLSTSGGLERAKVRSALYKRWSALGSCLPGSGKSKGKQSKATASKATAKKSPASKGTAKVRGTLRLRLRTGGSGRVSRVDVIKTTLNRPAVQSCAVKHFVGRKLPAGGKPGQTQIELRVTHGLSSMFGSAAAIGSLKGGAIGRYGVGGLGLRGSGRGGGGAGSGTIGIGTLGTRGSGKGRGTGYGSLRGSKRHRRSRVTHGKTRVQGALSKEIIRRIIRRHLNQLRYCYEKELVRAPKLSCRHTLVFVIGPDGKVQSAKAEAKANSGRCNKVGGCAARMARRWRFPKPKGGGVVRVRYPLRFRTN